MSRKQDESTAEYAFKIDEAIRLFGDRHALGQEGDADFELIEQAKEALVAAAKIAAESRDQAHYADTHQCFHEATEALHEALGCLSETANGLRHP
ncbi:hypothetical protein CKO28_18895 [Rhodovibrio sodomensis]|uniref:DUF3077 domain-containing protein n=1 Tax=Rhodovibrio sodomensis TaxID=1088 RepID=A0ABS1DI24_9PROT|nr:hypothetical protein [Rhodovibrio sodomensis]MBK1670107.1 hypothetical protein [Rhodovibrio sodomensis]